jgi:hypothetical protein
VAEVAKGQKQFTFLKEGWFRVELRMGDVNWDWARIKSVAKATAKKSSVKGSGALNLEILWAGKPSNNNLPHYLTNARILLEQYGFKLNFNMNGDFQSSKLLDFQKDIVVSAAGNLDELAKVVVQRPEYKKGDSLVVVMGAARQHTDADKDDGGFRGICVGEEYGVTGNHFVLLNYNGTSPDGMTLLHEMTHAAGYHGHPGESGRKADTPRNVMTYGWRRNELDEEGLRKLNAAFFRKG